MPATSIRRDDRGYAAGPIAPRVADRRRYQSVPRYMHPPRVTPASTSIPIARATAATRPIPPDDRSAVHRTAPSHNHGSHRNPLPYPHLRPAPQADVGKEVKLAGWVHSYRDHGGLVFIDLRDRDGLTQLVFDADLCGKATHDEARKLRSEWVISVTGDVTPRGEGLTNPKLATGEIEVRVKSMEVLSQSRRRRRSRRTSTRR